MKLVAIISTLISICSSAFGFFIDDFKPAPDSIRDHLIGDWKTETGSITGKQDRVFHFAVLRFRDKELLETYSAMDSSGGALRFTNATVMISKADVNPTTNVVFHGDEVMCGSMFYGSISVSSDGFFQSMPPFGIVQFRRIDSNEYERLKIQVMRKMDKRLQEIWRGHAPEDIRSAYVDLKRIAHGEEDEEREPSAGGYGREDAAKPQR